MDGDGEWECRRRPYEKKLKIRNGLTITDFLFIKIFRKSCIHTPYVIMQLTYFSLNSVSWLHSEMAALESVCFNTLLAGLQGLSHGIEMGYT